LQARPLPLEPGDLADLAAAVTTADASKLQVCSCLFVCFKDIFPFIYFILLFIYLFIL